MTLAMSGAVQHSEYYIVVPRYQELWPGQLGLVLILSERALLAARISSRFTGISPRARCLYNDGAFRIPVTTVTAAVCTQTTLAMSTARRLQVDAHRGALDKCRDVDVELHLPLFSLGRLVYILQSFW